MLTVGSLFSGIGGIDLGLRMTGGFETRWFVEIDPWCRRVLAKHWPDVPCYEDVTTLDGRDVEPVDLLAAGFPCQPVSLAGQRRGQDDERWLWPHVARLVGELRPRFVLLENVPGLLSRGMSDVLGDLAACGYDAEWDCIPAAAVGAPHRRDRLWVVAYPAAMQRVAFVGHEPNGVLSSHVADTAINGCGSRRAGRLDSGSARQPQQPLQNVADADERERDGWSGSLGAGRWSEPADCGWWATEPALDRVASRVSRRVDRLRGLGNAVVPQVVEHIGRLILEAA